MTEQIGVALRSVAWFSSLGLGTTGLTVTVDVYRNGSIIVTGASATEIGGGFYGYTLADSHNTVEGLYLFLYKTTTTTVDQQHLVHGIEVGLAGVENLDASISSRMASAAYTAPDNASISSIKAKTDNLPSNPADESLLEAAIAAIPAAPTAAAIDAQLSGTHGTGTWGSGGGMGAIAKTVTITVSGLPRDGVEVWITTDSAGVNVVASGTTDALGEVDFMLDAGTYYVWKQLSGVDFTNPETMVVS